ncbi:MAG: response regulator [Clostridiales bacterium]|nr:response regulator [Candidatus Apopatocola equi]MCQ2439746.1 response regulator [Oscillospiraceae bacterium]
MRILLIDDEPAALNLLRKAVKEAVPHADIAAFDSSLDALHDAEENRPDVVFSDIRMPELSGLPLAKALKKLNPKVNIIFSTGYSEYKDESIFLHVSGYITKPVTAEDVRAQLDNLLYPIETPTAPIHARTFGNFDLFVDGKAVAFNRSKSKELLAYLIDRHGAAVPKKELCAILYDGDYSISKQNYFTQIYAALKDTLDEYGCGSMLLRRYNSYAVDISVFTCDSYAFLEGDTSAINRFRGEYMEQYSWAAQYKTKFTD